MRIEKSNPITHCLQCLMLQPSVCGVVTAGIVPLLEEKVNQNGREGIMAEAARSRESIQPFPANRPLHPLRIPPRIRHPARLPCPSRFAPSVAFRCHAPTDLLFWYWVEHSLTVCIIAYSIPFQDVLSHAGCAISRAVPTSLRV
jgi:hypothetical protein